MLSIPAAFRRPAAQLVRSWAAVRRLKTKLPAVHLCPPPRSYIDGEDSKAKWFDVAHNGSPWDTARPYREEVIICTGSREWSANPLLENHGDTLFADIVAMMNNALRILGKRGPSLDPLSIVFNSSFSSSITKKNRKPHTSALFFPSFKDETMKKRFAVEALVERFLVNEMPVGRLTPISTADKEVARIEEHKRFNNMLQDVKDVFVLVCGQGGNCSEVGPLLMKEFKIKLVQSGLDVRDDCFAPENDTPDMKDDGVIPVQAARVGLMSHDGPRHMAGHVTIYIPPGMRLGRNGPPHPLAGLGVRYGMVSLKNVEGLVLETVVRGRVVMEKFRGGSCRGGTADG
ncbi:FMI1 protein [Ophiocordyceps camponoti-floridani]|uniref:Altered inheritance of mitochondria protein 32 n=1 Tax=Ophiocordyceps camponoti-floridani TaxID=2030778 RepID=A0A8H4Q5N8_9HYPO|nr:FMI1 protein [Ophiocordyceps camponoti-floridani]